MNTIIRQCHTWKRAQASVLTKNLRKMNGATETYGKRFLSGGSFFGKTKGNDVVGKRAATGETWRHFCAAGSSEPIAPLPTRLNLWFNKREPPANWMHVFLIFTNGMGVVAFMFGLWSWQRQQRERNEANLRNSFLKDLDRVSDQAMTKNPELMLSEIKTYLTMIQTTEPHKSNLDKLVKELKKQGGGIFARKSAIRNIDADLEEVFTEVDKDGDGVITMAEIDNFRKARMKSGKSGEKDISKIAGGLTLDKIPMYAVADEVKLRELAVTDYWLALRNRGDTSALRIEQDRAILRSLIRKAMGCYRRNPSFQDHNLMKQMLHEEPLTDSIVMEYMKYVEPLMMAISRKDLGGAYYASHRDETFVFVEKAYPEIGQISQNPFQPGYEAAKSVVRMPTVGDRVLIIKSGSQYGNTAIVTDPTWFGRVKVQMEDGKFKSYIHNELEVVEAGVGSERPTRG
eukprot:g3469.t1